MTKAILSKFKPQGDERTEWEGAYTNAAWAMEPLALALLELAGDGAVSEADLKGADALAVLAYRAGARSAYLKVLGLLPPGALPEGMNVPSNVAPLDNGPKPWYNVFVRMINRT